MHVPLICSFPCAHNIWQRHAKVPFLVSLPCFLLLMTNRIVQYKRFAIESVFEVSLNIQRLSTILSQMPIC